MSIGSNDILVSGWRFVARVILKPRLGKLVFTQAKALVFLRHDLSGKAVGLRSRCSEVRCLRIRLDTVNV